MIYQNNPLQRDQLKRSSQGGSQMSNSQQQQNQYREALIARAKLNARKSFSVEDDFEFYPNFVETRMKPQQHILQHFARQPSLSPYSTPTKLSSLRVNQGFMSPGPAQQSPQQNQLQLNYNSPLPNRRVENVPTSPMYSNTTPNQW